MGDRWYIADAEITLYNKSDNQQFKKNERKIISTQEKI